MHRTRFETIRISIRQLQLAVYSPNNSQKEKNMGLIYCFWVNYNTWISGLFAIIHTDNSKVAYCATLPLIAMIGESGKDAYTATNVTGTLAIHSDRSPPISECPTSFCGDEE